MKKAINRLRYTGIDDIVLLTGDVEQHAEIIADRMTVDRYKAEAMPDDKAETVLKLQSKGTHVVMVGDGINDAPALAYADVGIAMGGTRTDIAMEAADITVTGRRSLDDPGGHSPGESDDADHPAEFRGGGRREHAGTRAGLDWRSAGVLGRGAPQ